MKNVKFLVAAVTLAAASAASGQSYDLSGCWRNIRNDVGRCYVEQLGHSLWLTNEHGSRAYGEFTGPRSLLVPEWNGTRGIVAAGGNVIIWSGNGQWNREPGCGRFPAHE